MNEILELREGLETFLGRGLTLRGAQDVERGAKEIVVADREEESAEFFHLSEGQGNRRRGSLSRGDSFGREGDVGEFVRERFSLIIKENDAARVESEESKSLASFFPVLKSMRTCNPGGISWHSRTSVKSVVGANARG